MNYTLNSTVQAETNIAKHDKDLEEQLTALVEWKQKAMVQLEYFRTACSIYNFCDVSLVNELLNNQRSINH